MDPFLSPITLNPSKIRCTLVDVATEAGVSKSTASRVMQKSGPVKETTRCRVLEAARRLRYRPDPMMSAFSAFRHRNNSRKGCQPLAFIVADLTQKNLDATPFSPDQGFYLAARERAETFGYQLDIFYGKQELTLSGLARKLYAQGYLGILVEAMRTEFAKMLPLQKFPAVVIDRNAHNLPLHSLTPDWRQLTRLATAQAVALGYRRIGFVHLTTYVDDSRTGALWWEHEKLIRNDRTQPRPFLWEQAFHNGFVDQPPIESFQTWLTTEKPDVIISDNVSTWWWLQSLGIKMPGEIGYINIGNCFGPREARISRAAESVQVVGARAIEFLDKLIRIGERGYPGVPLQTLVPGEWYVGKTAIRQGLDAENGDCSPPPKLTRG